MFTSPVQSDGPLESGNEAAVSAVVGAAAAAGALPFSRRLGGIGSSVPCLEPEHRFQQVCGPERSVR